MIKFSVNNRFSGVEMFTASIDCEESENEGTKAGLSIKWAIENEVDLYGADLRGADLYGANFRGANLRGAEIQGANLYGADLSNADLSGANLRGADLRSSNLYSADLRDVDLYGADLYSANFRGALIKNNIKLTGKDPIFTMTPVGSESRTLSAFNTDKGVFIKRGCFFDTFDFFKTTVEETQLSNEYSATYLVVIALIETLWNDTL
jgi:uncharacterized protein YjbI with pentapeptide repeats